MKRTEETGGDRDAPDGRPSECARVLAHPGVIHPIAAMGVGIALFVSVALACVVASAPGRGESLAIWQLLVFCFVWLCGVGIATVGVRSFCWEAELDDDGVVSFRPFLAAYSSSAQYRLVDLTPVSNDVAGTMDIVSPDGRCWRASPGHPLVTLILRERAGADVHSGPCADSVEGHTERAGTNPAWDGLYRHAFPRRVFLRSAVPSLVLVHLGLGAAVWFEHQLGGAMTSGQWGGLVIVWILSIGASLLFPRT